MIVEIKVYLTGERRNILEILLEKKIRKFKEIFFTVHDYIKSYKSKVNYKNTKFWMNFPRWYVMKLFSARFARR